MLNKKTPRLCFPGLKTPEIRRYCASEEMLLRFLRNATAFLKKRYCFCFCPMWSLFFAQTDYHLSVLVLNFNFNGLYVPMDGKNGLLRIFIVVGQKF